MAKKAKKEKRPVAKIDFSPYGTAIKDGRKKQSESRNKVGNEMYRPAISLTSKTKVSQRVMKYRMTPLLIIFLLILLPQFLIQLLSTYNYFVAGFTGCVLAMYIVIFVMYFVKYSQYKRTRK